MNNILTIIGTIMTIVGLAITFLVPKEYQKGSTIITIIIAVLSAIVYFSFTYFYILLAVILVVSIVLNFVFYRKQIFMKRLVFFFEEKEQKKEYAEIIRWGSALSKALWLSHNFKTRKEIGKYVEKAAPKLSHNKALIRAKINDIGWTSVELLDYENAENIIKEGIELAKSENDFYMIAKGYRYLFSIYLRQGNQLTQAEEYLKNSLDETKKLVDGNPHKTELIAEYHFANASLENKKGNHNLALEEIEKAEEAYKQLPDKEWAIKINARKGDITLASKQANSIDTAITIFNSGLEESKKYQYLRQEVKNLTGLGACYIAKGKDYYDDAKANLSNAKKIAEKLSLYYELGIIDKHISNLNNKQL